VTGLSIVIVSYNAQEVLLRCLATLPAADVIVVDNASSDGSAAAVAERFPAVRMVANDRNEGFPVACNQGMKMASGETILLLNPDCEVRPGALEVMAAYLAEHPEAGIVGPRLVYADGSVQHSAAHRPDTWQIAAEYFFLERLVRRVPGYVPKAYPVEAFTAPTPVDSLTGAALMFRKDLVDRIGPLDPELFWIEDIDFCQRTTAAGQSVVYLPQAIFVHHSGVSARKNYTVSISNQIFNKIKYMSKHGRFADRLGVTLISLVHVLAKVVVLSVMAPFGQVYAAKARAYRYTLPRLFCPPARGGGL